MRERKAAACKTISVCEFLSISRLCGGCRYGSADIYMHPWSNGYDPGLPNRRRRFNSGRMLKNWKIMGIGVGNYFNILEC